MYVSVVRRFVSVRPQEAVYWSYIECCISKVYPLVCPHRLSHDSKHEWRLTVTHAAPCDRFGEHADTHKSLTAVPSCPLVKHRMQHCACSSGGLRLLPWPYHPKVKQLVRTRHPGCRMESCLFFWQTHTGAPLFSLLRFFPNLFLSILYYSHSHIFIADVRRHVQQDLACTILCLNKTHFSSLM